MAEPQGKAPEDEALDAPLETKRRRASIPAPRGQELSLSHSSEQSSSSSSVAWQVYLVGAYVLGRWLWMRYQERKQRNEKDDSDVNADKETQDRDAQK